MATGQDSCYKKSYSFIQNCHHHFNLRLLMELTCLNSIKSGPILTHPATHSKQMKLFHFIATRFNIYYCLLTLNRSIAESWWLLDAEWNGDHEASKAEQTHTEFCDAEGSGWECREQTYYWHFMVENSWKNNQKGWRVAAQPTHDWDPVKGVGSWRWATSRLTVWLSFPIYPMRYLRLMCLKVNTMRHTHTHTHTSGKKG